MISAYAAASIKHPQAGRFYMTKLWRVGFNYKDANIELYYKEEKVGKVKASLTNVGKTL